MKKVPREGDLELVPNLDPLADGVAALAGILGGHGTESHQPLALL